MPIPALSIKSTFFRSNTTFLTSLLIRRVSIDFFTSSTKWWSISPSISTTRQSFTFLKLVANDDGTYTSYIRKTTSGVIHITPLTQFDKYEPSEMFTEIDQRLLAIEGYIKDLDALNKATYENAVKDIRLDTEKRKVTLTNNDGEDTGEGIAMTDLSKMVGEDLTGKDPDGVQDGVVHLDQVIDLDKLLM